MFWVGCASSSARPCCCAPTKLRVRVYVTASARCYLRYRSWGPQGKKAEKTPVIQNSAATRVAKAPSTMSVANPFDDSALLAGLSEDSFVRALSSHFAKINKKIDAVHGSVKRRWASAPSVSRCPRMPSCRPAAARSFARLISLRAPIALAAGTRGTGRVRTARSSTPTLRPRALRAPPRLSHLARPRPRPRLAWRVRRRPLRGCLCAVPRPTAAPPPPPAGRRRSRPSFLRCTITRRARSPPLPRAPCWRALPASAAACSRHRPTGLRSGALTMSASS